jgi:predicted ATP-grasp superfamily ATP-dependent carboligase
MGFSGWMNSGEVSTASISYLVNKLNVKEFASIKSEGFYIESFPGDMEIASMFRPEVEIKDGLIKNYDNSPNRFFADRQNNLIFFKGKEPNINWQGYIDCVLELCKNFDISEVYFIASAAGLVPHTREPRVHCSVSGEKMKNYLAELGFNFTDYQGPASIVTRFLLDAPKYDINAAVMVSTVPAYVQGNNPMAVEAIIKYMKKILALEINIKDIIQLGKAFQDKINEVVQTQPELAENIQKLEQNYDNEVFDEDMGDLKQWLKQKGVKVD